MKRAFVVMLLSGCGGLGWTAASEQDVVRSVQESFDLCHHWGGELGEGDAARAAQIQAGLERDCPAAVQSALRAYERYQNNPELNAVMVQLVAYLSGAHGAEPLTKNPNNVRLYCQRAQPFFKRNHDTSKEEDPYFQQLCPAEAHTLYKK